MDQFKIIVSQRNDANWPVQDLKDLYQDILAENSLVRKGGNKSLNYEYGPSAWALKIVETATGKCIGGCIFEYWDNHVDNCLSVHAALIRKPFRHSAASHLLWRTLRWYAMGCQWICTTHYKGNNTYVTKYREVGL